MSAIDDIISYIQTKRDGLSKNNDSLATLGQTSPSQQVSNQLATSATNSITSRLTNSPLGQLGNSYIAEMVSKNGAQLINNVDTIVGNKLSSPIAQAQSLIFNTIGAALTAKNDLAMYFLQFVAQQAVIAIDNKRTILQTLQTQLLQLSNALTLLVAGNPFFNTYLTQMREALVIILSARNGLATVASTLQANNIWLTTKYAQSLAQLSQAEALLEPPSPAAPVNYTNPTLLKGTGSVTPPNQQMQLILSIPLLVQQVFAAATGYFLATAKVNLLLLGFLQGYSQLSAAGNSQVNSYTITTLGKLIAQLDVLISDMAYTLNGSTGQVSFPLSGFTPNPTITSSKALQWILQLKTVIAYAGFVPGTALSTQQISNDALTSYDAACLIIKNENNRTGGGAVLNATQGQEDIGQLEIQITQFCLAALQAIVDAKVAKNILALGQTMQARCNLTFQQDLEIENALKAFINHPLPLASTLAAAGAAIFGMLDGMGLDRAKDLLAGGNFKDFFNLNVKNATYAGAALIGIGVLKQCLTTDEDRQALTQAERVIQRDNTAKQLYAQRGASTGIANQQAANTAEDKSLAAIQTQATKSSKKCNILPSSPTNLLASLGGVLAVSGFGGPTLPAAFTKLGKGIL